MFRFLFLPALVCLAACSGEGGSATRPMKGVITLSDAFTGDFELVGPGGATRRDEDFEGKVMLVYFGFTHCPDVCPIDSAVMSAALTELGDAAGEVAPLFISVDPERDTPEALADYLAFDKRITPLTGTVAAADAARAGFKQYAAKEELPGSALGYTVNHARFFYIADRQGQPIYAVPGGIEPAALAAIVRRVVEETAA